MYSQLAVWPWSVAARACRARWGSARPRPCTWWPAACRGRRARPAPRRRCCAAAPPACTSARGTRGSSTTQCYMCLLPLYVSHWPARCKGEMNTMFLYLGYCYTQCILQTCINVVKPRKGGVCLLDFDVLHVVRKNTNIKIKSMFSKIYHLYSLFSTKHFRASRRFLIFS